MGEPVRRENGKWQIRWQDPITRRRRSLNFRTLTLAKQALRQKEALADRVKAGLVDPRRQSAATRRFGEVIDYWLKHRTLGKRNPRDDRSIVRAHLRPRFGCWKLAEIDTEAIDAFRSELLSAGLAANTINNVLGLLGAMLRKAEELKWIDSRPFIQRAKADDFEFNWIDSLDKLDALLAEARIEEARIALPGLATMYGTSVYTGARQGEVAALAWPMVNFDTRLITIAKSFHKPTKTQRIRRVPILDALLPMLKDWRERCPKTEGDLVFPNAKGNMHALGARAFKYTYHRVLDNAKVVGHYSDRRLTYHDLRHTFASLWMQGGGDLFRLQKILGHSNVQMTLRYAHLSPGTFAEDHGRLG